MSSSTRPVPPLPAHWEQARPFRFNGVDLLDTDLDGAVASMMEAAAAGTAQGLHLCNAFTLTLAGRDESYLATLSHPGSVNLPDGTPVSWFYRLAQGERAHGPVRGPSLMMTALRQPGRRHFLLGGSPEVLRRLVQVIAQTYPEANVVGSLAPPFRDADAKDIEAYAGAISASGAEIVWVGLGTPRQDRVIASLTAQVDAVLVGVGAAFDFLSGHKREAPTVLHRTGLEWVYRLLTEPRRLWRRYLIGNSRFVIQAARQLKETRR